MEIAFDGTPWRGWQWQPSAPSVQEEVQRAMRLKLHRPAMGVVGCGRTDTGVHASSYWLHFDTESPIADPGGFCGSLNQLLHPAIAVKRLVPVDAGSHARFSATGREYTYMIHGMKDPFRHGRSWLLRIPLDVEAMQQACRLLIGRQDFSCFQRTGSDVKTSVCDVRGASWQATDGGYVFTITADRYLRNMVRAIVGTCIRMGKGQWKAEDMQEILASKDRSRAGKSAPACGLYLSRIAYPFIQAEQA